MGPHGASPFACDSRVWLQPAAVVCSGGGSVIAGGTFTDRVFVGFGAPTSGVGGIIYCDQLWFRISPN